MAVKRSSNGVPTPARWRRALLAGVALLALPLFWVLLRRHDPAPATAEAPLPASAGLVTRAPISEPVAIADAPRVPSPDDPERPLIDSVTVDKREVCRGEENFVTVKAHTRNGTDAYLVTQMLDPGTGRMLSGNRLPFRLTAPPDSPLMVFVRGRGAADRARVPDVRVKDCDAPYHVRVGVRRSSDAPDIVSFSATVEGRGADGGLTEPFPPKSFVWELGDGTRETTTAPEIRHSYETRDQGIAESTFLVTVKVAGGDGQTAEGSTSIGFANLGFGSLVTRNQVALSVRVEPGDAKEGRAERISLYHGYSQAARIEAATLRETVIDADGRERETLRQDHPPARLLGFTEVGAKQIQPVRDLSSLQPTAPTAVRYVDLRGRTSDGKEVIGSFSLLPANREAI